MSTEGAAPWVQRPAAQRTNEAIIRSFPGRVLTVTVLASRKRPFSFDSCVPAATPTKCARLIEDAHTPPRTPVSRCEIALLKDSMLISEQTARTIRALMEAGRAEEMKCTTSSRAGSVLDSQSYAASEQQLLSAEHPGDFPLLVSN